MRILVAGIGNVFLGDDGFGVEVARRLSRSPLGEDVDVVDFGIRGIHLAFELADGRSDAAILVDAVSRGGEPGTLYAIEADVGANGFAPAGPDAHGLTPDGVLAWLGKVGEKRPRVVVVGCEPATTAESMELSAPVSASIDPAMQMIRSLVSEMKVVPQCA